MGIEASGVVRRNRFGRWPFRGRRPGNGSVPGRHRHHRGHRPATAGQGAGGMVLHRRRDDLGGFRHGLLRAGPPWPSVKAGQRVLVHAAAGGVGMAAVAAGPALGVWRCSPRPAAASGTRCGPWALTTTTSLIRAAWSSRTSSGRSPVGAAWMWCSTRCPAISWMLRCGWLPPVGCSWRWARPTSATPEVVAQDHPGVRYRAFDLFEAGPDRIQQMLAESGCAVRRRRAAAVAGDEV